MKRTAHALLLSMLLPGAALAATAAVTARSTPHGDHSRVVFTWPAVEGYKVEKDGDALLVTFDAPGAMAADVAADDARIGGITSASAAGQNLQVRIAVPAAATFQDFAVGNRVIVDVYGDGKAATSVPDKPPPPVKAAAKVPAAPAVPPKIAPAQVKASPAVLPATIKAAAVAKPAIPAPTVPAATPPPAAVLSAPPPALGDLATVAIALTEPRAAAAFIRNGTLWLVLAPGGVTSLPKITGSLPPFQRRDTPAATIFTTALPVGAPYDIYGEGSGLVWRLVLSPAARDVHATTIQRNTAADGTMSASWALSGVTDVLDVPDPQTGDGLKVAVVQDAGQFSGPAADTVDFTALKSAIGLALAEKADGLTVTRTDSGVQLTRPRGLPLSPAAQLSMDRMRQSMATPPPMPAGTATAPGAPPAAGTPIFDLARWAMPSLRVVQDNQRTLLAGLGGKDANGQVQDLLTMAKMNLANDRAAEASGFLDYAEDMLPALDDAAQFQALRGATDALLGRYEESVTALAPPDLQPFGELNYWRAYDFAWLEDWRQAKAVLPPGDGPLDDYPLLVRDKLLLKLAEVDLHAGDLKSAQRRLAIVEGDRAGATPGTLAGLDYLKGEAAQQSGDSELARHLWTPLVTGPDHLYRTRAGLALTALELGKKEIAPAKAIDRLEGLRYTWRGDELEAATNFALGKLYISQRKYLKGFEILRDAAGMDPGADIGRDISAYMKTQFVALLMQDKQIKPVEAAELYQEFPELIPAGADGDALGQRLAERLVDGDLLGRAALLLQRQVDTQLQGVDRARVASRLAAIYLLDKNPKAALPAAQLSEQLYDQLPGDAAKQAAHRAQLLQARALSQGGKPEDALAMLEKFPPDPDTNALRADIAWSAGMWDRAAAALQDMIIDQIADPTAPLNQAQADLILNRAVALNLSGNRVALANLHARYADAMAKTSRGRLFDIVARPRESALLSDKETLNAIVAEVDIFKGFLDSYRGSARAP